MHNLLYRCMTLSAAGGRFLFRPTPRLPSFGLLVFNSISFQKTLFILYQLGGRLRNIAVLVECCQTTKSVSRRRGSFRRLSAATSPTSSLTLPRVKFFNTFVLDHGSLTLFFLSTELSTGQLVKDEYFTLFEAVGALEVCRRLDPYLLTRDNSRHSTDS